MMPPDYKTCSLCHQNLKGKGWSAKDGGAVCQDSVSCKAACKARQKQQP